MTWFLRHWLAFGIVSFKWAWENDSYRGLIYWATKYRTHLWRRRLDCRHCGSSEHRTHPVFRH